MELGCHLSEPWTISIGGSIIYFTKRGGNYKSKQATRSYLPRGGPKAGPNEIKRERGYFAGTTNPGGTQKPDNPLKEIRNPIPRNPDNPLKRIHNLVPKGSGSSSQ